MTESVDANGDTPTKNADTGRYLYCLVAIDEGPIDGSLRLNIDGIEDEPVSIITVDDNSLGAVVHTRDGPYDSTDLTKLRDWLFSHQQVIEAAGDRFGTPLPVRFDTVLDGGDAAVTAWLGRNADAIMTAFDSLAGCWEYRVTLCWDSTDFEDEQRAADSELADIDRRLNQAGAGKRFLLQKQYDQRLRKLTQQRRESLKETLVNRLEEVTAQITERPPRSEAANSLGIELESDAITQVAVLASQDEESALGAVLDELMNIQGVDLRFTGPWPPYTFAPTIEED